MAIENLLSLFGAMIILALIPGPAVFTVISRSLSSGRIHGIFVTLGIVSADCVFVFLALVGLHKLSEVLGSAFDFIKYVSALYLIWFGYQLLNKATKPFTSGLSKDHSLPGSFSLGFFITLGNPKAILFYAGFFPAFVNIGDINFVDTGMIFVLVTLAIGGINTLYSLLAIKAKKRLESSQKTAFINKIAGGLIMTTGLWVLFR